jgi:hypothetical protein
MLILHQQQLVLEAVLLSQNRKHFVREELVELFVLVRRDVESNAARDLFIVDLLH